MPLRSPKMYSFILGFQRLVWCPKWTPASSSSFMVMFAKLPPYMDCILRGTAGPARDYIPARNMWREDFGSPNLLPQEAGTGTSSGGILRTLSLRELEASARTLLPVLLAFFAAGVTL